MSTCPHSLDPQAHTHLCICWVLAWPLCLPGTPAWIPVLWSTGLLVTSQPSLTLTSTQINGFTHFFHRHPTLMCPPRYQHRPPCPHPPDTPAGTHTHIKRIFILGTHWNPTVLNHWDQHHYYTYNTVPLFSLWPYHESYLNQASRKLEIEKKFMYERQCNNCSLKKKFWTKYSCK